MRAVDGGESGAGWGVVPSAGTGTGAPSSTSSTATTTTQQVLAQSAADQAISGSQTMPPPPIQAQVVDETGYVSQPWAIWMNKLWVMNGGTMPLGPLDSLLLVNDLPPTDQGARDMVEALRIDAQAPSSQTAVDEVVSRVMALEMATPPAIVVPPEDAFANTLLVDAEARQRIDALRMEVTLLPVQAPMPPVFGASGALHKKGLVPDPGSSAGTTKFLREDSAWVVPASGSSNAITASVVNYIGQTMLGMSDNAGNFTTGAYFQLYQNATCTGIRFVGEASHTYTLKLWSYSGTVLASTTVTTTTAGIYQGTFAGVALVPGTTYYCSIYNASYYCQSSQTGFTSFFAAPICLIGMNYYAAGDAKPNIANGSANYPVEPILQ